MRVNVASFTEDRTMAERIARMQHYWLPTRFADLSTNAFLSTLFAAGGCSRDADKYKDEDGFIRVIKVAKHKMKPFTSDTIAAISCLPLVPADRIHPSRQDGLGYLTYEVARERPGFSSESEWNEIGERIYPGDAKAYDKLVDIGHYKEGFATHFFAKAYVRIDRNTFFNFQLK